MQVLWIYLAVITIITFVCYGADKQRAVSGRWRISEATLLVLAAAGGALGALAGMYFFHHKTKKMKFVLGVPVLLIVYIVALATIL